MNFQLKSVTVIQKLGFKDDGVKVVDVSRLLLNKCQIKDMVNTGSWTGMDRILSMTAQLADGTFREFALADMRSNF